MVRAWPHGRGARRQPLPSARVLRRRLLPAPANDNAAPPLARLARILALIAGLAAILWTAAGLLAP
jgi:hypothetical protein